MKYLFRLTTLLLSVIIVVPVSAHFRPMVESGYPAAPPPLEPGEDWAVLVVTVLDARSGERMSATVSVNGGTVEPQDNGFQRFGLRYSGNRLKGLISFRKLDYYFYTDGRFTIKVPPGECTLELARGYEFKRCRLSLNAEPKDTLLLTARLERWTDMAAQGWYAGDTHIHMDRTGSNDDSLLALTSARGIRFAYLLSMNTTGYGRDGEYESWLQAKGLGDGSVAGRSGYFLSSGQEYRSGELGHVTVIMTDDYVDGPDSVSADVSKGPSLGLIADQAHRLRGYIGLAHGGYDKTETDGLLLDNKMDFLELLQFGGYRSLGLDGWYDFLNIGFRLPLVGACDFPYTRELGSEITYVYSDKAPTPRNWVEMAAAGKSFATSGPMFFLDIEGHRPGSILTFSENVDTTLTVNVRIESPLYPVDYVEIIVGGWPVFREQFDPPVAGYTISRDVRISSSTWIAARAGDPAGTEAHANPVYIYIGGRLPFNRDSARQIITRLEGSMEIISSAAITGRLGQLKLMLEAMLDGRPAALPLPRPE